MDPTETLRQLLQALKDDDRELAKAHALNLASWLSHRGFLPSPADVARVCAEFAGENR